MTTPRDLDAELLRAACAAAGAPDAPVVVTALTRSTNDDAKAAARAGAPHGAAFVADAQLAGRGRGGHAWHSPPGENLYASWVFRPRLAARALPPLSLAAGLAVVDAVAPWAPHAKIKWPNDVLVDDGKLAGVLVEALLVAERVDAVIVGIGVNVHTRAFPPPLDAIATSLALLAAEPPPRAELFARLSSALASHVERFVRDGVSALVRDVRARDALAGRAVTVDGEPARAVGLDEDGALLVETRERSLRRIVAGEVLVEKSR